jgi:hypothetical protein
MAGFITHFNKFKSQSHKNIPGILVILSLVSACMPVETPLPIASDTQTTTPTAVPSATVEWFPATATPTILPTLQVSPTPDFRPNIGELIFSDDFSEPAGWTLGTLSSGTIALGLDELTIAISEPGAYLNSIRQEPTLSDFYLEVTTNPTLCRGEDQYGLLLRTSSPNDFYRYSLSCDGRIRLDRIVGGIASTPQPWTISNAAPPGAPISSRLGVWAKGKELRFFVNDQYQFTVIDPLIPAGLLGLFTWSAGDTAVTVNFSDLVVHQITQ